MRHDHMLRNAKWGRREERRATGWVLVVMVLAALGLSVWFDSVVRDNAGCTTDADCAARFGGDGRP